MTYYDQRQFDVRCEWGSQGLGALAESDVVIVVDVLSFTTSVEIAVSRGVTVFPYPSALEVAPEYARQRNAQLAQKRSAELGVLSLAPSSLVEADADTRLVLPSPNGSALSFQAAGGGAHVAAGCLRNASAVTKWVAAQGGSVAVIPAGERWHDGSLRPAFEDLIEAGALIRELPGQRSPEAQAAAAAFEHAELELAERLQACSSGRELIDRGFERDVELASELNVSETVPVLLGDTYTVDAGS